MTEAEFKTAAEAAFTAQGHVSPVAVVSISAGHCVADVTSDAIPYRVASSTPEDVVSGITRMLTLVI